MKRTHIKRIVEAISNDDIIVLAAHYSTALDYNVANLQSVTSVKLVENPGTKERAILCEICPADETNKTTMMRSFRRALEHEFDDVVFFDGNESLYPIFVREIGGKENIRAVCFMYRRYKDKDEDIGIFISHLHEMNEDNTTVIEV